MSSAADPFTPVSLGELVLKNRFIRSGCYEGYCRDGLVTDMLIDHHRQVAEGGVAMTTVAYGCVSPEGRTFADQIVIGSESRRGLEKLAAAVHAADAKISIQLTHGGYFADPKVIGGKPLGASRVFNDYRMTKPEVLDESGLKRITEAFGQAALVVKKAGFDAVEVHAGHGYLLSQFLSPYTNRRNDDWGGDHRRRNAFPAGVVRRIRSLVGEGFPILVKMNTLDGFKGGIETEHSISAARAFQDAGATALIPSCGSTSKTPFMMLRGKVPVKEMARGRPSAGERLLTRLFGRLMVREFPFEPLFLLRQSREILRSVTIPVVYVGGVLSLEAVQNLIGDGFEFVQVGRATIRDPNFVNRMAVGEMTKSDCDSCNRCVAAMDSGGVVCVTAEEKSLAN